MWTFRMYSHNTKTTNEPTTSNNKLDRPQVNIWDTWKTLKYLNINDPFHLKDLEISKYQRESKGRWPIQIVVLFLLIVVLFVFLNIKSVKIYAMPFIFSTTLVLYKLDTCTLLLKQKNLPVLDITGFFFRMSTNTGSAVTSVQMRKKKPVISNTGRFFCFNNTVSYTYLYI
jgi:uncharacterized integral membrane protein